VHNGGSYKITVLEHVSRGLAVIAELLVTLLMNSECDHPDTAIGSQDIGLMFLFLGFSSAF